jgi:HAD superfamily hydrolase (TIGR01457 family)
MRRYSWYLLDMDGVIYRGNELLPGARHFMRWLEETGRPYLFLTNNSTAGPVGIAAKMTALGLPTPPDRIVSAGVAAAHAAARHHPGGRALVLGSPALMALVAEAGCQVVDALAPALPDVVVVGLDREISYARLAAAQRALLGGATFIAVNRDPVLPVEHGMEPGAGAIVAAVEVSSGVAPQVIGKPEPAIVQVALEQLGARPAETLLIGDGLALDIPAGERAGVDTVLLLSGITTTDEARRAGFPATRTFANLAALLAASQDAGS